MLWEMCFPPPARPLQEMFSPSQARPLQDQLHHFPGENGLLRNSQHQSARKRLKLARLDYDSKLLHRIQMTEEEMEKDPEILQYLTGLSGIFFLKEILVLVAPCLSGRPSKLSSFQEVMLTLVKLRLNIQFTFLGFIFNVNRGTASRIFYKWIDILYMRMRGFITWPEREALRASMPASFKEAFADKVAVILDCFEIKIERLGNPDVAAQTWSSYKHHHTIKVLIGMTPQGHIAFVSKAYVDRASDTYVTESCGVLNNLLPEDVVLADRGFRIKESVSIYAAVLHQPAFKKGKPQLSPQEIEGTREIANVRIHVERIIGLVREKFKILKTTLPVTVLTESTNEYISSIDKIITVCCALATNVESII